MKKTVLFLFLFLIGKSLFAITYYVSVSGSDKDGCGTLSQPFASIAEALTNAVSGDSIRIGEGVFGTKTKYDIQKSFSITILGAGRDKTILQADPDIRLFEINGGSLYLKDLGITGINNAQEGGAIIAKSLSGKKPSLTCENIDFVENTSKGSPALRIEGGVLKLIRCNILRNTSSGYGAVSLIASTYSFDEVLISGCLFEGNIARNNGTAIRFYAQNDVAGCVIKNNTFTNNRMHVSNSGTIAVEGGDGSGTSRAINLINNTITGNAVLGNKSSGVFINGTAGGVVGLINNIITDNVNEEGKFYAIQVSNVSLNEFCNNIVDKACRNTGELIIEYPQLAQLPSALNAGNLERYTSEQIRLKPLADNGGETHTMALGEGSVAINAGKTVQGLTDDQRGYLRDGKTDIGAYEYNAVTSVEERPATASLSRIYPNPVLDLIYVTEPVRLLEVYSINGQKIMHFENIHSCVDLKSLASGNYLIRLVTHDHDDTISIIKK